MRFKVDVHFNLSEIKVNKVIRFFVLSDLLFYGGWGLVNPIFSLFVIGKITGATVLTVGIAFALYWTSKALFQIPIALYLDHQNRDRLDLHMLIIALIFSGFISMSFPLISNIGLLYFLMVLQGIAFGLYTPSWSAVFSRHLDKNHYAFDWSLDSTTIGISSGIAALVGGTFAQFFGFETVFVFTGFLSFAGGLLLLAIPDLVLPKATISVPPILPEHVPGSSKE